MYELRPVLLLTPDDLLWAQWRQLNPGAWQPVRGHSWSDLMRWVLAQHRIVVLDPQLPGMPAPDSSEWQSAARAADVLVADPDTTSPKDGRHFLLAGAKGYLSGNANVQVLARALTVVAEGGIWLGSASLAQLLQPNQTHTPAPEIASHVWSTALTRREREVAKGVARGLSNKSIAEELGITERTVRAHVSAVFEKLGVSDRLALALIVHGVSQRRPGDA